MAQNPFQAVWFDLDGTLFDTAEDLIPAVNATLADFDYPLAGANVLRRWINFGARGMLSAGIQSERDDPRVDAMLECFSEHYLNQLSQHTRLFPGMDRILNKLDSKGIPWGIVTNKAERFTIPLIEQLGYSKRITGLVCGDTTDESKPSAKPLLYACAVAGHDPEHCLYAGDNSTDIIAGKAASMRAVVACAYGYVPEGENPTHWGADYVIDQAAAFESILWD
ncbi:HAD-IA family hydrolase [Suttonella sp. R2A3]|uniref:HAD-IA family hydrolase n=1 Tax=Suttonella sp. R2A3 TaxID=2908648 RepID=UPI001F3BB8A7|nr:HAD-IA family hydrolase [Suttonella sp. R2A3]UJF24603.1 HAD-IA family hydrolase [Suttonella sp. R2A3]